MCAPGHLERVGEPQAVLSQGRGAGRGRSGASFGGSGGGAGLGRPGWCGVGVTAWPEMPDLPARGSRAGGARRARGEGCLGVSLSRGGRWAPQSVPG